MRTFRLIIISLFPFAAAIGQPLTKSIILTMTPASKNLELRLNQQIASIKDTAAMNKLIRPAFAKARLSYLEVFVYHEPGDYDVLFYKHPKAKPGNLKMTYESKGTATHVINRSGDFNNWHDTIVMPDSLQLEIDFETRKMPRDGYYIKWLNPGTRVKQTALHADGQNRIYIFAAYRDQLNSYQSFELHNSGNDLLVLSNGWFFFMGSPQKQDVKRFIDFLLRQSPRLSLTDLAQLSAAFVKNKYGPVDFPQFTDWLSSQYPNLTP